MSSDLNMGQNVGVRVIRKDERVDGYMNNPVRCLNCSNLRYWVVRCEHCGIFTQTFKKENVE